MKAFTTILALIAITASVRATVIYSTYGGGLGYSTSTGYSIYGATSYYGQAFHHSRSITFPFTPSQTFDLAQVKFAISGEPGLRFALLPDAGGMPSPAANAMASASFDAPLLVGVVSLDLQSANLQLQGGTPYWVAFIPNPSSSASLALSTAGAGLFYGSSTDYGNSWSATYGIAPPAFEIDGTVVPEPAACVLLIAAIGGMALRGKQVRSSAGLLV